MDNFNFHQKSSLPFQTDVIIVSIVHQIKTKTCGIDTQKLIWGVYATQWVGLGLWVRCVSYARQTNFVIYARGNYILYASQTRAYHMQCWEKLLLKVMHYSIALLPKNI